MADRIEELFDEYLDLVLTKGTPRIEDFLEAHPELDDGERDRLRRLAASVGSILCKEATRSEAVPPASREVPETFGHYRILGVLGRGGQGVVYLAEDARLSRKVALKVLRRPDLAIGAEGVAAAPAARLRREAELASKLDHPGICVVYETGVVDDSPYVAMRYLDGETLASLIAAARAAGRRAIPPADESDGDPARGRASLARGVVLVESAARALHAAHSAGVVHRDVKPANIMVTRDGAPVLLDFGLARDQSAAAPSITQTGQQFGSPGYMSPEQIAPTRGGLDARTDVYSLGVVLFECLTLRRPFDEPTRESLFDAVLHDPLPDPRPLNGAIDRDLTVVLATALERDLDRRYRTALDFAEDLRRWRSFEPIRARPASWLLRAKRWTQRNRVLAASAAAVVLLLTGLLIARESVIRRQAADAEQIRGALLTAQSSAALAVDPALALLLATEAAEIHRDRTVDEALHAALARLREERTLEPPRADGGGGGIVKVVASSDGRRVVSASKDGVVQVWDVANGRRVATLRGPARELDDVDSSPDGRWIAGVSVPEKKVFLWSTASWSDGTGVAIAAADAAIPAPGDVTRSVRFSADGERVLARGEGGICIVDLHERTGRTTPFPAGAEHDAAWDAAGERMLLTASGSIWRPATGESLRLDAPPNAPDATRCGDFSPDGAHVVLGSAAEGVRVFDARTGATTVQRDIGKEPHEVRFAPDGRSILAACVDGACVLLSAASGEVMERWRVHAHGIQRAAFSRDGRRITTTAEDGTVQIRDAANSREIAELLCSSAITSVCEIDGGARFVSGNVDGSVRQWECDDGWSRGSFDLELPIYTYLACAFDPGGKRVAFASGNDVVLCDLPSRRLAGTLAGHTQRVHSVVFTSDGHTLFTSSEDRTVRAWDAATCRQTAEIGAGLHDSAVWCVDVSPDGERIVTTSEHGCARLFERSGGALRYVLRHDDESGVQCAHFSPDGRYVVTASPHDHTVRVWDVKSGTLRFEIPFEGDDARPRVGRFSPDGRTLVAGTWDGTIGAWDATDGHVLWKQSRRPACVNEVAFDRDGTRFVVGVGNVAKPLGIWDLRKGDEIAAAFDVEGGVSCAAFSPNGATILSIANDRHPHLWPADPLAEALRRRPRDFTPDERRRFLSTPPGR
jgi:WD40 repeat protein/serine/threonine protein kinase